MNMTDKATQTQARGNYALPIVIMFALFFMIAFVTGYQNPLGDVIKNMTGGNVLLSQLGTFANFIAYACMGIPAGIILERKGYRLTALWAVTVGFIGVLVTYLSGFIADNNVLAVVIYIIGAFIAGFSMCMLNTVVNPMLNSLGRTQNQGNQLVQFGGSCNSLGATLAPVIVGGLLGGQASSIASANPVFYLSMAIFAIAWIVLYLATLPEAPDFGKKKEKIKIGGALRHSNFAFGAIAIFCYVGIEVGIANLTYQYLSDDGLGMANPGFSSSAIAGTVVGIYWLLMLVGRLVGGAVAAKISSRVMLTITAVGATALLILGIYTSGSVVPFVGFDSGQMLFSVVRVPLNSIFFIACGLCTSVMWGAIYNLSVEGLGKYTAVASGLFMTMVCGGGILPFLQGLIADSSILASFWLPAALCIYLLCYAVFLSRPSKNAYSEPERLYENGEEVIA